MPFKVRVADNFHYMDEDEISDGGTFATAAEAVQEARRIVDAFLLDAWLDGMTAEDLFQSYVSFGEDPFIVQVGEPDGQELVSFSGWTYAEARCRELCGEPSAARSVPDAPAPQTVPDELSQVPGPRFEIGLPDPGPKSTIVWRGATMVERAARFRRKPPSGEGA